MDVHAPHHPIGGLKDFMIHIVTITVGLLIAVGIEGLVEKHHEHVLVGEARETMRAEIEHNSGMMKGVLKTVTEQRAAMKQNIAILTRVVENAKDQPGKDQGLDATFRNVTLDDTAWRTAQTTGALAFMPYAEAEKFSDVYHAQTMFQDQQDKILDDEAKVFGDLSQTDFGHGDVTREQATALLHEFGVWQAHLLYLDLMAKLSSQTDEAFLSGKDAPKSLHEDMNN